MNKIYEDIIQKKSEDGKDLYGFTISSKRIDRQRERMNIEGVNLRDFKPNAQMFYNHNSQLLPIGNWREIKKTADTLTAWGEFETIREQKDYPNEPVGRTIKEFVDKGFLNATSIGFQPTESEYMEEVFNGKKIPILEHKKWDLLEASIVNIPANPDALRQKAIKDGFKEEDANLLFMIQEKQEIKHEKIETKIEEDMDEIEKAGRIIAGRNLERMREAMRLMNEIIAEMNSDDDGKDYKEMFLKLETEHENLQREKDKLELKVSLLK